MAPTSWVRSGLLLVALAAGLVVLTVAAGASGAFRIPPSEVLGSILHRIGLGWGSTPDALGEDVLWQIRFPRVALTVLVGGSLGCAGALMQGTFSNPLAEPGIVGVSSGAALGAVLVIVTGLAPFGTWSITGAAFVGGLATVFAVYAASRADGRTEVITMVLTGIALNALTGAVLGLLTYYSDDAQLRSITFWTLGSMAQATWTKVAVVAPLALVGIGVAPLFARRLDLLALGDGPARHLGVDVERTRRVVLLLVAVLTASAVAISGQVLFVGLVIPHLVRMVAGPGHRLLIPGSALAGATILVGADLAARTMASPAEVPLGVLTALVGSPFFFWQLRRMRARQGGWA
ncbi:MAG TPA: iron ABC transporter permease [Acidimicrobiales bacterium]|nr:iron ABC transporter permease [Acidimicrobiales bacterium]